MMNIPQEALGAVPQPGVNPQSRQAPAAQPQPQAQPGQQGNAPALSPQELKFLRTDPEIAEAVSKFMGRQVDLSIVPDELLTVIAGMVHKLGVDGAVQEAMQKIPPDIQQQIQSAV